MRSAKLCLVVALAAGCSSSSNETEETSPRGSSKPSSTATSTAKSTAPATVTVEPPKQAPGVTPRIKQEVDKREDGVTGNGLTAAGASAVMQTAKEWTVTKGEPTQATSADKKAGLAASSTGEGKLDAALKALGLSECQWSGDETLTVGKNKLVGSGADGVCKRNSSPVKAAKLELTAEKLLVVGAWEDGGDDANLFGALRSIVKGGGSNIAACCKALEQNAVSAPLNLKPSYLAAASMCRSVMSNPDTAASIRQIQAAAKGAGLPADCK